MSMPIGVACTVLSGSMPIGMASTVFLDSLPIGLASTAFFGLPANRTGRYYIFGFPANKNGKYCISRLYANRNGMYCIVRYLSLHALRRFTHVLVSFDVTHYLSDHLLKHKRYFAARGGNSLLWPEGTTFLSSMGVYSRTEITTVARGKRARGPEGTGLNKSQVLATAGTSGHTTHYFLCTTDIY